MAKDFFKPGDSSSASSKFGQLIGEAFENTVIRLVKSYIGQKYPDYEILAPTEGRKLITLEMLGGSSRQLDTVIAKRDSEAPIALLETKWLKDSRHHNEAL